MLIRRSLTLPAAGRQVTLTCFLPFRRSVWRWTDPNPDLKWENRNFMSPEMIEQRCGTDCLLCRGMKDLCLWPYRASVFSWCPTKSLLITDMYFRLIIVINNQFPWPLHIRTVLCLQIQLSSNPIYIYNTQWFFFLNIYDLCLRRSLKIPVPAFAAVIIVHTDLMKSAF